MPAGSKKPLPAGSSSSGPPLELKADRSSGDVAHHGDGMQMQPRFLPRLQVDLFDLHPAHLSAASQRRAQEMLADNRHTAF